RALLQAKKALEMEPAHPVATNWLGIVYELMGNYKEAMEQWAKLAKLNGNDKYATEMMQTFATSGYRGFLKNDAAYYEAQQDYNDAAGDYAMLGDKDAAFANLNKAFSNRTGVLFIKTDPVFDNLRSDPRFTDLLHRIGLPQ